MLPCRIFLLFMLCFLFMDLGESQLAEWIFGEPEKPKEKPWERPKNMNKREKKRRGKDPDFYRSMKMEL